MKILISSGGTSEKIDQVRYITNHATGRLGQTMAQQFLAAGHQVTLLAGKHSLLPQEHPKLTVHRITDTVHLMTSMEPLVKNHDVLVHAMAVSDYSPVYMTDFDTLAKSSDLTAFLDKKQQEGKISSDADWQVLFLKKTPKIISLVKNWNPSIMLFGFKLLVDVSREELISVARESLVKNRADYILANDLSQISENGHKAYLVNNHQVQELETKDDIAQAILEKIQER